MHAVRRKPVSISSACLAARVSPTTALRLIDRLVREAIVERRDDPRDGRRSWLTLTPEGRSRIEHYLRHHEG